MLSILRILVCVRVCVRNQVANWARRSPLIKKPILGKLFGAANNLGLDPFPHVRAATAYMAEHLT